MKSYLLWLFLGVLPLFSAGQTTASLEETFYNLPINSSRDKIREQILSNNRFTETGKLDTSFLGFNNNSYLGYVVHTNLPPTFKVDSATIELTWGYGMFTKPRSKGKNLTFIRLQYFVSDSLTSYALAKMLWDRHKSLSSDTFDVTVGLKEYNNFSYGKKVNLKRKQYLPSLSVLQQEYNNKVFVVRLEYERLGN